MSDIDPSWMDTNIVKIADLQKMQNKNKWNSLNNHVEGTLAEAAGPFFGSEFKDLTQGNNPAYDFTYKDGTKVEVKTSAGSSIYVEVGKIREGEMYPSGLALTEADYHLFLRGGTPTKKGPDQPNVYKLHIIKTGELRKQWAKALSTKDGVINKNGTLSFKLDIFNIDDGLLGYFPSAEDGKSVELDITKFNKWLTSRDRNGSKIKP